MSYSKKINLKTRITGIFLLVICSAFLLRVFPSLYGDEYGSLRESKNIFSNSHAIGYFVQFYVWRLIGESDLWLRLLSVLWALVSIFGCFLLGKEIGFREEVIWNWMGLLGTNAFFLQYAMQVRFYSFFLAVSILFYWRVVLWMKCESKSNLYYLLLSALFLLTSHLFGWLVAGVTLGVILFRKHKISKMFFLMAGIVLYGCFVWMLKDPANFGTVVNFIYKIIGGHDTVRMALPRGLSPAMLIKIPFTAFFFIFGERVYPGWWWITLPGISIISIVFIKGLKQLRFFPAINMLCVFLIMSILGIYLIVDPLAPIWLQGASARYAIYALPLFILVCILGSGRRMNLLWMINLISLTCFFFPRWSYGQSDLFDWKKNLKENITKPSETCLLVDGRSEEAVMRYSPKEIRMITREMNRCQDAPRILLISNDYRVESVRYLDDFGSRLGNNYHLIRNIAEFPVQISVFDFKKNSGGGLIPARLGLPEQDLKFPLQTFDGPDLQGFIRLDSAGKQQTVRFQGKTDSMSVMANYLKNTPLNKGVPVLKLSWTDKTGNEKSETLRAGIDIGTWKDSSCSNAVEAASWFKRIHLVGKQRYDDMYRQFKARIWEKKFFHTGFPETVQIESLLPGGTVYLFAVNTND